jgi:[ribosomal protein S5]-alanine N-acetyltransferase
VTPRLRLEHVGRVRARALLAGDLDALAPLRPARGWPHADTMDGLRVSLMGAATDADTPLLAVLDDTDEVVGEGGWKGGPGPDGVAEIGYGLAAPYRGQGLGTELVGLLTTWVLQAARQVVAEVLADNVASRRALERNGYVLTHADEPYVWYAYPPSPRPRPDPRPGKTT